MRGLESKHPLSLEEATALADEIRRAGDKVVFTNGVFDLLHPGHVRYLRDARALGGGLIMGINSDASVRRNKGADRPLHPASERAEILLALECVTGVTIFDADTPLEVISAIKPDLLVKGADWAEDRIVGREVVESLGGRVVRMTLTDGYSTTHLIRRVQTRR